MTRWNRNVVLSLVFVFTGGVASGVFGYAVLSAYLLGLTGGSNTSVGFAEGLQGIVQVVVALPCGWVADVYTRSLPLRVASVIGISFVGCTLAVLHAVPEARQFPFLCGCLGLLGAFQGAFSGSVEALFADSVPTARRSEFTTYKFMATALSSAGGPATSLFLFLFLGDTWTLQDLRFVFTIGCCLAIIPSFVLCFFSDRLALGAESDALPEDEDDGGQRGQPQSGQQQRGKRGGQRLCSPLLPDQGGNDEQDGEGSCGGRIVAEDSKSVGGAATATALLSLNSGGSGEEGEVQSRAAVVRRKGLPSSASSSSSSPPRSARLVPIVSYAADVIISLGSGMTIKFFPLWFKGDIGLSPAAVSGIYCATPVAMALFSMAAQRISRSVGRIQTAIAFKCLGIALLLVMSTARSLWQHTAAISALYIVRTCLMNCVRPLQKSVLNDHVAKDQRGRWNAVDSIQRFGWSGSAMVGGYWVDNMGYGSSFVMTAALQFLGVSLMCWLLPFLRRESRQR